ncbi:ATP-dependent RNA helicase mak5 [Striga asiatica]|uniref:ATP-dependent RNA helicase mak5 n=1 Tax=Striga asiatica TaxID=4170 RepID=A0A5A7PUA0_STRAF|nr:ATP-dependent RNA helicase mak5 [Striga asiatica]
MTGFVSLRGKGRPVTGDLIFPATQFSGHPIFPKTRRRPPTASSPATLILFFRQPFLPATPFFRLLTTVSPQFEPPRLFKDGPTIPAWRLSPATPVFPAESLSSDHFPTVMANFIFSSFHGSKKLLKLFQCPRNLQVVRSSVQDLVGLGFEEAGCGRRTRSSSHFLAANSTVGDFLVIMTTAERFSDIQDVGEVAYCGAPVKQSSWMKMTGRSASVGVDGRR